VSSIGVPYTGTQLPSERTLEVTEYAEKTSYEVGDVSVAPPTLIIELFLLKMV